MRMLPVLLYFALLGFFAAAPARADDSAAVAVVTHIDVIPDASGQVPPAAVQLLKQFVLDSRKDPGVEYFTLITWSPTTNHFQMLELYKDRAAFDRHVSAAHSIAFRDALQQYVGAPYDERLYHPVYW